MRLHLLRYVSEEVVARKDEGDVVLGEDLRGDLLHDVNALAPLETRRKEHHRAIVGDSETLARIVALAGVEELEVDPVVDDLDRSVDAHARLDLVGEEARARHQRSGTVDRLLFEPPCPDLVGLADVVGAHDELGRAVKLDHGRDVHSAVDVETLCPALGHLDDVVAMLAQKFAQAGIHALCVLEPVPCPGELHALHEREEFRALGLPAISKDRDAVVFGRAERRCFGCTGQHVHFVAKLGEAACLVPGVGADTAEAGLWRILEGKESDLHLGSQMRDDPARMRVLYVLHQFYPKYVSGTEQYVLSLARAGRARGDDVRVFALDPDFREQEPATSLDEYEWLGVPTTLYRFDKSAIRNHILTDYHNPEVGGPFRELLDSFEPDAVHFFHLRWNGIDRLDEVASRGIPSFVHLMDFWFVCPIFLLMKHDGTQCDGPPDGGLGCFDCTWGGVRAELDESGDLDAVRSLSAAGETPRHDDSNAQLALAMARRLPMLVEALAGADRVFAPSRTVERLLRANGHALQRLELVPYALDLELIGRSACPQPDPIVFGFVGTLAPHKGLDCLIAAFRQVTDDSVRLRVHGRFGDYPAFDDEVRALADGDTRIEFCGSFDRDRLPEILGGLHAVVVPSRWRENTPFVCLEARAAGLALIASDVEGIAEMSDDGEPSRLRLFANGDSDALAAALSASVGELRERAGARLPPDPSLPSLPQQYEAFRQVYSEHVAT